MASLEIIAAPQESASCGQRKCRECGKQFKLIRSGQRIYCSKECKKNRNKRWYHEKFLRTWKFKIFKPACCMVCENNFVPTRKDQVACRKCSKKLANFKRSQKAIDDFINRKPRKCIICGAYFKPKRKDSLCCCKLHRTYSYQKLCWHVKKNKTPSDALAAAAQRRRSWYYNHEAISKQRSHEQYKKPERKEKINIYREYGKGANPPAVCKKLLAIKYAFNHGTLQDKIKPISEGKTYAAYL